MIQYFKVKEYVICMFLFSVDRVKNGVIFKFNLIRDIDLNNGFNVDLVICASDDLEEIFDYIFNNSYYS